MEEEEGGNGLIGAGASPRRSPQRGLNGDDNIIFQSDDDRESLGNGADEEDPATQREESPSQTENPGAEGKVSIGCDPNILKLYNYEDAQLRGIFTIRFLSNKSNFVKTNSQNLVPEVPIPCITSYSPLPMFSGSSPNAALDEQNMTTLMPVGGTNYYYFSPCLAKSIFGISNFCYHQHLNIFGTLTINGHQVYCPSSTYTSVPPRLVLATLAYDALMSVVAYERGYLTLEALQHILLTIKKVEGHPALFSPQENSVYRCIAHRKISLLPVDFLTGLKTLLAPAPSWRRVLEGKLVFTSNKLCGHEGCTQSFARDPCSAQRPGHQPRTWTLKDTCCESRTNPDPAHYTPGRVLK